MTNQVIPAQAVEAAAASIFKNRTNRPFSELRGGPRVLWLDEAKEALEAAAPHMLAAAWQKGRNAGQMDPYDRYPATNPYRSER